MKTIGYFLSVVAVLVLAGCATTFRPWNLSRIEEGMDRAQVMAILGYPDYTVVQGDSEHLYYTYQEDLHPSLSDGMPYDSTLEQELMAQRVQRSFRQYEYEVVLVNNKVENYKEVLD